MKFWSTRVFTGVAGIVGAAMASSSTGFTDLLNSSALAAPKPMVLSCNETRARIGLFLDMHFLFRTFDDELSKRTFKKIFEMFDPGKMYFTLADVSKFSGLETKIDDLVNKGDCKFVEDIYDTFKMRVKERLELTKALLSKDFDFKVDEQMPVGKTEWATTDSEISERWRKRIKFQVMNLKEALEGGEVKARERLRKKYESASKTLGEQNKDEILNSLINAFALALDPHSSHFLPEDQEDFNIRLGNQLEGIGATLQEDDGYITVQAIVPGGAASRDARLKAGDKIIAVDSGDGEGAVDVIDMDLSKAVRLIRGKKGTIVKLIILRKGPSGTDRLKFEITRDAVKLTASEAKSDVMIVDKKKIGVINLPAFYTDFQCRARPTVECQGASFHVEREVKKLKLQKVDGIILDLRNNGGGDLSESVRMSGLFIPEGTVVQTVDRRRMTRSNQDQDPSVLYDGPMAVMINKYSASASEIVSGALQDWGRALILGDDHTYGKATVQVVQDIPGSHGRKSNGAIKVTMSKFYRPSGTTNQEKGVFSDVEIPSLLEVYDVGEKENDYVLKSDTIKPASDLKPLQDFSALVPKLKKLSASRLAADKEFKELTVKMEKARKEKDKATVSLMEDVKKNADRKKERLAEEAEAKEAQDEKVIIRKADIQLKEAGHILSDAMDSLKPGQPWVAPQKGLWSK
jgi:carboxyl-terminal processing protease